MDQYPNAPAAEHPQFMHTLPPKTGQELIGPTDALNKSGLDLGLMRMEMETAMEHALRHRRNIGVVIEQIRQMALYTDASASRCVYALPRKEKAIIGPSAGFATIVATAWGNCVDSGWWVRTDRENKVVVCAGSFIDLQTNRRSVSTVTRRISGRDGRLYNDDMIAVTIQAATSIGQRNATLKGVPHPVWGTIYEEALVIVRGSTETLPERRHTMVASFAQFGVEPRRIFGALGVRDEREITLDHMVMLRGMYEQLRDEQITAEELFDPRRMTSEGFERVERPLADERTAARAAEDIAAQTLQHCGPDLSGVMAGRQVGGVGREGSVVNKQHYLDTRKEPAGEERDTKVSAIAPAPKASPEASHGSVETVPYFDYAKSWIKDAKSVADIEDRWKSERKLRHGMLMDDLDDLTLVKNAAISALQARPSATGRTEG